MFDLFSSLQFSSHSNKSPNLDQAGNRLFVCADQKLSAKSVFAWNSGAHTRHLVNCVPKLNLSQVEHQTHFFVVHVENNWKSKQRLCSESRRQSSDGTPAQSPHYQHRTQAQQCLSSNFLSKLRGPGLSSTQINGCGPLAPEHAHNHASSRETTRSAPSTSSSNTRIWLTVDWRNRLPLVKVMSGRSEAQISMINAEHNTDRDWKWIVRGLDWSLKLILLCWHGSPACLPADGR